ncbi:MAG TPA: class I SAM-dependent methyltransferase [Acidimicrobiales bacterium]
MGEKETLASYDRTAPRYAELQWATRLVRQMHEFERSLAGNRICDLGCGPGRDVEWQTERGHDVIGVDLSVGMLAEARRRVPAASLVVGDATALPLATASVDGVWSCSVFVHLDRVETAEGLGEVARVLRPGGAFYLGLERGDAPEWRDDSDGGRRRFHFWQPDALATAVEAAGFGVTDQYVEQVDRFAFLTTHALKRPT